MEIENVSKAATFKKFSSQGLSKHTITFFMTVLFNYFHKTNINRRFLGITQKQELRVSFKATTRGVL